MTNHLGTVSHTHQPVNTLSAMPKVPSMSKSKEKGKATSSSIRGRGSAESSLHQPQSSTSSPIKVDNPETKDYWCVMKGETTEDSFSVNLSPTATVDELKRAIKKELGLVNAERLILWKRSIPESDDDGKTPMTLEGLDETAAIRRPKALISSLSLDDNTYIIVEQPSQAPKRTREDDEVDRDSKRSRAKTDQQLWDDWHEYLRSNIEVQIPPELYPMELQESTGRFQKAESRVPFNGSRFVDLRLDTTPTAMGKKLSTLCKQGGQLLHVLFAVSGAGKTRSIFDAAMQNCGVFLLYIECNPETLGVNAAEGEPTGDRNFIRFYEDMERVDDENGLHTAKGRSESRRLIALEYTSRVLFLILLLENVQDLTPRSYLLSQLNGGQKSIEKIKDSLIRVEEEELSLLFRRALEWLEVILPAGSQFAIAIDEATVGSKLFYGKFTNVNNHITGVLTPLLEYLSEYPIPKIIAGTSFSLRHGEQIRSDVGKGVTQEYLSNFEPLDITAVEIYIQRYLDFSDCDFTKIENWEYLAGRPRLAARLLLETVQSERTFGGSITKQSILEIAVKNTLAAVGEKLSGRLNSLAAEFIDSKDPQKSLMQDALRELFLSCRFLGGCSRLGKLDDNWTRLVDCGVASLTKTPDGMFVHVEELLATRTVNLVLGLKYTRPTETLIRSLFKKLATSTLAQDTSKGKAWEYLILSALLSYNGRMVNDFIRIFYGDSSVVLPQWTSHAIFNVASYGDADMFTLMSGYPHEDDTDVINKLLDDANSRTYILQPANIMRPDGLYIGRLHNRPSCEYWTLLFSAKFYNTPMSSQKTIDEDRASTNWSLAYHTKKGKVEATDLVTKLQGAQRFSAHQGSLRIHFVLPGLAASKDGSPRGGIQVEDNDVLMDIDRSMLKELFQSMPNVAENLNELLER